jgi:hypothetical protein
VEEIRFWAESGVIVRVFHLGERIHVHESMKGKAILSDLSIYLSKFVGLIHERTKLNNSRFIV